MNFDNQLKQIMSVVLEIPVDQITENSSSDDFEQWDSLKHLNLVLALEEEFGIEIPDEDVTNITSFKIIKLALADLVKKD